ncbi:phosphoenolpyruvate phosphomutase [Streptomyces griseochromogenes]|uniref:Phosphoenolpyruvate phosphomutase n=1 Tax=Streptomyces griseochromogenes TaxID=68214 RepID=A0A1B1B3Z2_9ACTN|nr:isocitrate lyase/phosphoenolpyruvate mutase family protein [Streptomyces griseochromogenes]ANP53481.1 phosphoenolpyruvate phosphomutase [Streptomyces griseochromogenes]MBP2054693.1 phosphoenolpyruvate phosphomutase [Streptomyces griseochromogenes]
MTHTTDSAAGRLLAALRAPRLARAMGAHNPLSARLAEETGFDVIWSSGLEISAAAGVPDANILAMPECLDTAASLTAAVDVPVLADCDSGFGNVNNVIHMVRSYEARGVAGVCIEDKQFPKLNSFVEGNQDLAPLDDFAGKIRAAVDVRRELVVVARLEALISGLGMDEALRRAEVYERAGADALLIHSKRDDPDEVFAFREAYDGDLPVIVVPTTYNSVTADELQSRGFAMAIYANQALRSSVRAMRHTLTRIMQDGTTHHVEDELAPLKELFDLQRMPQMLDQQSRYEALGRELAEAAR